MPLTFPSNPSLNQVFNTGTFSFVWNGSSWVANGSPPSADLTINAANSAGSYANAAFIHANAAFNQANTGSGGITNLYEANTTNTGFFALPAGNTAERIVNSPTGAIRFNTSNDAIEFRSSTTWISLGSLPAISNVSPSQFDGTNNSLFYIYGSNFTSDAQVYFVTSNGSQLLASTVTYTNSGELRARTPRNISVAEEPISVKVVQNSGQITLNNCIDAGGLPTWVTSAGSLGSIFGANTVNVYVSATDPEGSGITYTLTTGALPNSLTLNTANGLIQGIASSVTSNTTYNFTIQADDTANNNASRAFSYTVLNRPPTWNTAAGSLFSGTFSSYSTVTVNAYDPDGNAVTYTVSSGSLPSGLYLGSSNGNITGSATEPASNTTSSFDVSASDGSDSTARSFTITIQITFDPHFANTVMLLAGNGTNGANNNIFTDSSNNNFTITRNGNPTQGTFTPFTSPNGRFSSYYDSTITTWPESLWTELSGISWTAEFWFYPIAQGGQYGGMIFGNNVSGRADACFIYHASDGTVGVTTAGSTNFTSFGSVTALPLNRWSHVAITISGSSGSATGKIYINGVLDKTQTSMNTGINGMGSAITGTRGDNAFYNIYGFLSNFRIVKNQVLYTGNFTPAAAPLTTASVGTSGANVASSITGTVSVLIYNDAILKNYANTSTVVSSNSSKFQRFSPFSSNTSYSASTNAGSGYFDGSGDYLSIGTQTAFGVGTGAVTIEAWFYPTVSSVYQGIISTRPTAATLGLVILNNDYLEFSIGTSTLVSSVAVQLNSWNHGVGVRSTVGGTTTASLFLNGVRVATSTSATGDDGSTRECVVGRYYTDQNNYYFTGYISGARIVKGTAVYDPTQSTLTIPTAPATNISNTSVLFNFTNGGIVDSTMYNNLETVGNAQISTTQSKFGGASMYFDGTGDWLIFPSSTNYALGTGDFTIEMWLRTDVIPSSTLDVIFDTRPASTQGAYPHLYLDTDGKIKYYVSSADRITSTNAISTNTWYHVALTRSGTSTKLFIDGTQTGSTYTDSTNYIQSNLIIGAGYAGTSSINYGFQGYMDDFRLTKGFARYTANFTAPTAAFPTRDA